MNIKKFLGFLCSLSIGFLVFLLAVKFTGWKDIKGTIFIFFSYSGLLILVLTLLVWVTGFWKWKFILKSQGYNLPTLKLGEIFFAGYAITYLLTPTAILGGEGFRVYALSKKFPVPWHKNISALVIEKILSSTIILIFLLLGFFAFIFSTDTLSKTEILILIFLGLLSLGLVFFYVKTAKKQSFLKWFFRLFKIKGTGDSQFISGVEREIFNFCNFKKIPIWKGLGIAFLKYFLVLIRCWVLIFFLTNRTNILISFAVFSFMYLAYFFPFPAGLGSLETVQAFVFGSLGLGPAKGITFSFLLRCAEILVSLFGLLLLIKFGINLFMRAISNLIDKFSSSS